MEKFVSRVVLGLLVVSLVSCVSLQDRTMTPQERERADIVGSVTVTFTSTHFLHIQRGVKEKAYAELKKAAQQKYPGNIDIQNIVVSGSFSGWNVLMGFFPASFILLDVQKITATGDVVSLGGGGAGTPLPNQLEGAMDNATRTLIDSMPQNATVAILSVYSDNRETAEYVIDELEYKLVNSRKFQIVDRRRLEQIRREQNFQLSGDVDDNSAVSIGNMLGATIVITGDISGSDSSRRLVLKALDVRTARIITMARERF